MALSRSPGWRDTAASELAARHATTLGLAGPALVLDDPRDALARALEAEGMTVRRWWRSTAGGRLATPWPPRGSFGTVALRLPKSKARLEMTTHAAAARLDEGGRLLVYGAKDEGAGSASARLEEIFADVRSVATGGRCRLLVAATVRDPGALRDDLDAWAVAFDPGLDELGDRWISFPGVFAHGRLDAGTALLIRTMGPVSPDARVLDFGCGHGVLGAAAAARAGAAAEAVTFLDVDAVALEAVRRNVPGGRTVLSDGWSAAPHGPWDVVVSNPPYHRGKGESFQMVRALVEGAAARLDAEGWLAMVVQRRFPAEGLLRDRFGMVDVRGDEGPWRAWRAWRPRGPRPADPGASTG